MQCNPGKPLYMVRFIWSESQYPTIEQRRELRTFMADNGMYYHRHDQFVFNDPVGATLATQKAVRHFSWIHDGSIAYLDMLRITDMFDMRIMVMTKTFCGT